MQPDDFPEIHRWIRPRLRRLSDFAVDRGPPDRARVEHWLEIQLAYLGVRRPPIWAEGPQAAWRAVATEPWRDLSRHATQLAEVVAVGTARKGQVYGGQPALAPIMASAEKAADDVVGSWIAELFQAAVNDPVTARRMDGVWRTRWARDRRAVARGSSLPDAWLWSRAREFVDRQLTEVGRDPLGLGEPLGWSSAWIEAWVSKWAALSRPAGRAEPIDDKLAVLLETVGERVGTITLRRAHAGLAAAVLENRRDVVYGAWRALGEFSAGPPTTDIEDWRPCLRRYWRPFYEQAAAGLGWCWFTSDSVVCLPRPHVRLGGDRFVAIWPDGEEIEGPAAVTT